MTNVNRRLIFVSSFTKKLNDMATNLQIAKRAAEILTEETGEKHTASYTVKPVAIIWNGNNGNVASVSDNGFRYTTEQQRIALNCAAADLES